MVVKECCDWREKLGLAIERNDQVLVREIVWNWNRFGTDGNGNFDCEDCSEVLEEMHDVIGTNTCSPQEMRAKIQKELKKGTMSCCEVVEMLDVNDPNKTILHQQAVAMKLNLGELACLKCKTLINWVIEKYEPKKQ